MEGTIRTMAPCSRQRSARAWTENQWHTACAVVVASMALVAIVYVLCAAPAVNATTLAMGGL